MLWLISLALLIAPAQQPSPEEETISQLAKVRRVYVDILTGGDSALQIRDLLMTSLQNSKLFIITEDEEKADAVLKGSAGDETFTDLFQSSEGINAHTQVGGGSNNGSTRVTGSNSSSRYASVIIGENESRRTEERKHEAIATVRLVNNDGDVIWSATAESFGAKFMGASADVADKIAKRLAADFKVAKGKGKSSPPSSVGSK